MIVELRGSCRQKTEGEWLCEAERGLDILEGFLEAQSKGVGHRCASDQPNQALSHARSAKLLEKEQYGPLMWRGWVSHSLRHY